jgi:hypothetical protein
MALLLDHIILAVNDLAEGMDDYRALGFNVIPGGVHSNGATHNALICFEDGTYIELLAATGNIPQLGLIDFSPLLKRGEGLVGFALRSDNLEQDVARLQTAKVALGPIILGERQREDGTVVQWRVCLLNGSFAPCLIEDVTPHHLRVPNDPAITSHTNRALGLNGLTILVRNISASAARYTLLFEQGPKTPVATTRRDFRLGTVTITLEQPNWYWASLNPDEPLSIGPTLPPEVKGISDTLFRDSVCLVQAMVAILGDADEALYQAALRRESDLDDRFTLDKTHGLRLYQESGTSRQHGSLLMRSLDKIDWSKLRIADDSVVEIPDLLRQLMSDVESVREGAAQKLYDHLVTNGISEATLAAIPILIDLLDASQNIVGILGILMGARANLDQNCNIAPVRLPLQHQIDFALKEVCRAI